MMIKITFPDNSVKEFESGITPLQIAESISPRLAQEVLAATVDGQEWDLSRSINADAAIKLLITVTVCRIEYSVCCMLLPWHHEVHYWKLRLRQVRLS